MWWLMPVIPAISGSIKTGSQYRLAWIKNKTPISKITKAKKAGGVA
jgi:hypothetical protein